MYAVLSCFSRVWLVATLWTIYILLGSSIHGILQVRIVEWDVISLIPFSSQYYDKKYHLYFLLMVVLQTAQN